MGGRARERLPVLGEGWKWDFLFWEWVGDGISCLYFFKGRDFLFGEWVGGGTSCLYFFKGRDFLFWEWVGGGTSCLYFFKGRDFLFWERVGGRTSWLLGDRLIFGMGVVMGLPVLGVG